MKRETEPAHPTNVEQLLIKNACAELVLRTASLIDQGTYAALNEVFAADAVLLRPGGGELNGIDAIVASYQSRPADRMTRHLVLNTRVDVIGHEEARGVSQVLLWSANLGDEVGPFGRRASPRQVLGVFDDQFIQSAGLWQIQRRTARFELHHEPLQPDA